MDTPVNIFWFRRDLRLDDNAGLYHSLKGGLPVVPVFVFDKNILDQLEDKKDRRVEFIYKSLELLQSDLLKMGSSLEVYYGEPLGVFEILVKKYQIQMVYTNQDYEPYARKRDEAVALLLKKNGVGFQSFKDQVIFEKEEIAKEDGLPYTVFTPYSKKWKAELANSPFKIFETEKHFSNFHKQEEYPMPSLSEIGFEKNHFDFPIKIIDREIINSYKEKRDYPSENGTTQLSVHLRFGTISIRKIAKAAMQLNEVFLNELIWRDFYQMIMWNFPHVGEGKSFKPAYDFIEWRNNEEEFEKWCNGLTGYPIVDAGMRSLNQTGFMHNRVRMIVASFLTKHLLIDWRWGEAYFAKKLLDFDLAANNGGWQWAAGSGCDAAPYFRVFNPYLQTQKFDPELKYIRQWVPELEEFSYPKPIVEHDFARKRALDVYSAGLKKN